MQSHARFSSLHAAKMSRFLMVLLVSTRNIPGFYICCGFEVKEWTQIFTQDPILKLFKSFLQEGKGHEERGVSSQQKENTKYSVSFGI